MNKSVSIIITVILVIGAGIIFFEKPDDADSLINLQTSQNVEMLDGVQYVAIEALGGYSPELSLAKANLPTKLIVKTNGTYDCSAALVIRSIGFQKILPQQGQEIIDLGTPEAGALQGLCSMGMYHFTVNFTP